MVAINGKPVSPDQQSEQLNLPSGATLVIDNEANFSYTPPSNWAGVDSFNYTIESPSGQMATAEVDINVDLAPPTITAPASETVTENVDPGLTGIIIGDISPNQLKVTFAVQEGLLTIGGQGPASEVTYTGTVNDINLMLARGELNYESVADFVGSDTLTITAEDLGNAESATSNMAINVDQLNTSLAPLNVYTPPALSVPTGMQLAIAGLGIDDPNATVGTMKATFTVNHGTVAINPCQPGGVTASQVSYNTAH